MPEGSALELERNSVNRRTRLGRISTASTASPAAPPLSTVNSRAGAPTTNSRLKAMAAMTIEVPMSPPSITSPMISPDIGSSGTIRWSQLVSRFSLRSSRSAPHSTRANLANSLGWIVSGPITSQFWLPPVETWPKASTASSSTRVISSSG